MPLPVLWRSLLALSLPACGWSQGGPDPIWVRQIRTPEVDFCTLAASDVVGGVFLTGYTLGVLGAAPSGGFDSFLVRMDGSGNELWTAQLGTADSDGGYAVIADGKGGLFLLGSDTEDIGAPPKVDWMHLSQGSIILVASSGVRSWVDQSMSYHAALPVQPMEI